MNSSITNIVVVIDVVGALADDSLDNNIYLMDNKKVSGSEGEGTSNLKTAVKIGDCLIWTILSLECEAYAAITGIEFEDGICNPELKTFEKSDITYWKGKILRDSSNEPVKYKIKIEVGNSKKELIMENGPSIIFK